MRDVFIVSVARTPVGGLLGGLSPLSAVELGALSIGAALERSGLDAGMVESVYMGNVLSAGLGQSPARQAAVKAGIPYSADATTVNKVCASGMKAIMLATQQIQSGDEEIVLAGGMESMSNVPHYVYLRQGKKLGNTELTDGMTKDGLWDAYHNYHMGNAAEMGIRKFGFTRDMLDEYALESYRKAQAATKAGKLSREIIPVTVRQKGKDITIDTDEDIMKVIPEKMPFLTPAFEEGGVLTAGNSSNLNDGAVALILASADAVAKYKLQPLARIVAFADGAREPEWFTIAPAIAIEKTLNRSGLKKEDIDFFEINEAYASVVPSNSQLLDLDPGKINCYGGAVATGHPIGASGARIMVTLLSVLHQEGGRYGMGAICNGGGGASAMLLERI